MTQFRVNDSVPGLISPTRVYIRVWFLLPVFISGFMTVTACMSGFRTVTACMSGFMSRGQCTPWSVNSRFSDPDRHPEVYHGVPLVSAPCPPTPITPGTHHPGSAPSIAAQAGQTSLSGVSAASPCSPGSFWLQRVSHPTCSFREKHENVCFYRFSWKTTKWVTFWDTFLS